MRKRTDADDYRPTLTQQQAGLPMFAYPAGSKPKPSSEEAADQLLASGKAAILRRMALERLAHGPVTADAWRAEVEEAVGKEIAANSIAPRFSELQDDGFARQDTSVTLKSRYGGPCHPYAITDDGTRALQRIRQTEYQTGLEQYVNRFGRKK
jgi:DNA-binding PadR family transcriptional regulator